MKKLSIITSTAALAVGAALVLTGCGSHASTGASAKSPSTGQSQGQGGGQRGGFGGAGGGGTIGQIAAIDGTTLQVQDSSSQTAVSYSSSTAITKTVSVDLSAVTVGSCITATTAPTGGAASAGSGSSAGSAGGAVTSVSISQPTGGSCATGFGGGQGGARPTDRPSIRPSNRPSGRPSGAPSGGFGGGNFVAPTTGQVTAVSGSTITVNALDFQTQKTASKTVTVDGSTKYSTTQSGAASDLVVGQCVVARGKADDSGTVAATALTVSAPLNGSCTSGFGGFGGRGGFGGGQRGGNAGTGSQSGTTNG